LSGLAAGVGAAFGARALGFDPLNHTVATPKAAPQVRESARSRATADEQQLKTMIADLQKVQEQMEADRQKLALEKSVVAQERSTLEQMKAEMDAAEKRIDQFLFAKDASEEKNTKRIAKLWGQMEPSEVYEIAKGLDELTTARILYAMNDRQAAPVLEAFATKGEEGTRLARVVTERLRSFAKLQTSDKETKGTGTGP
jgi:hypothetical protein